MCLNYENLPLSNKEKIIFLIGEVGVSLTIGWIFYDSWIIGIIISVIFMPTIKIYKKRVSEKKLNILLIEFKDLLYSLSSEIATGATMSKALEESVNFWRGTYDESDYIIIELNNMVKKMKELHINDIECLEDFARRSKLPDIVDFVNSFKVLRTSGADMTTAIERTSDIIRDKIILESELKTVMSQKVFESRLVGMSPVIMVLFLKLVSPGYFQVMYETSAGKTLMTFALVLMMFSLYLIERNNRIEV